MGNDDKFTRSGVARRLALHQPQQLAAQRRAAVAFIFRNIDADLELLYIKRSEHPNDPWSGHMALPGGRIDATDSGALAAAVREANEEVSLDLTTTATLIGQLDDHYPGPRSMSTLAVTPFVFGLDEAAHGEGNIEVEQIHWFRANELTDEAARSTLLYSLGGHDIELPCLRLRGRVIWGLTYRMTRQLLALLGWANLPDGPS